MPENPIMLPSEDKMVHLGKGNAFCEGVALPKSSVQHVAAFRSAFQDRAREMWLVPDDLAECPAPLLVLGLELMLS